MGTLVPGVFPSTSRPSPPSPIQFLAQSHASLFCYKEGWFGVTNTHKQRCDVEPSAASLRVKKRRHRDAESYPGSLSYEGAELGSKSLAVPLQRLCRERLQDTRPPPQAGAGQGKQEAGRSSWLSAPHLTTSRALRPPRKSHQKSPLGLDRGWGPSWNSSCLADPTS